MATTLATKLDIRPLAGSLGAEIRGIDLSDTIGDNMRATLRSALLDNLVLFFPDQHLEPSQLKEFGKTWGKLVVYDVAPTTDNDPEIVEIAASDGRTADVWHTDQTFQYEPPFGSVLSLVKSPSKGGDTMWSSQYEAYEKLSPALQSFLGELTAIHELPGAIRRYLKNPNGKRPEEGAEHPVVATHPETGRSFLYINRLYTTRIPQLSRGESDALLGYLFTHSEDPRFNVRYRWSEGTVAIWDNRCTQHCVVSDFDGERVIRRVTIGGTAVEGPKSPWEHYNAGVGGSRAKLEMR